MARARKPRVEWDKLSRCEDHSPWMAASKEIRETFHVKRVDAKFATSQAVAVHVDSYHKDCNFEATLTWKKSRFYLNFTVKWGGTQKQFVTLGSSHGNYVEDVWTCQCCGGDVPRNVGYEKRRLHGCRAKEWGHISRPELTESDIGAFIKRAGDFANITFVPDPPLHLHRELTTLRGGS